MGFVLVSKSDYIVVLEEHLTDNGALFSLTKTGKGFLNDNLRGKYQSWFDIVEARNEEEVLATYQLPVTKEAGTSLSAYGIPARFPAVIHQRNSQYSSYYFAGDYSAEPMSRGSTRKGLDSWKKHFGQKDSFYWTVYVPLMKDLLENRLSNKDQEAVELVEQDGIKSQ